MKALFLFVLSWLFFLGAPASCPAAWETVHESGFGRGRWQAEEWLAVKSPRWDYVGSWVQRADHIQNAVPPGTPANRLIGRPHAYTSMVLAEKLSVGEGLRISSTMEFEFDQGPQIVLADGLGAGPGGYPEYRRHLEVVLWSRGVNIWRHDYRDGQPGWTLVSFGRFPVEAGRPRLMEVLVERPRKRGGVRPPGLMLTVTVGSHSFGYHEPEMPGEFYAGIIGYASRNRFYDFTVAAR